MRIEAISGNYDPGLARAAAARPAQPTQGQKETAPQGQTQITEFLNLMASLLDDMDVSAITPPTTGTLLNLTA
jgi:hypothetical protein